MSVFIPLLLTSNVPQNVLECERQWVGLSEESCRLKFVSWNDSVLERWLFYLVLSTVFTRSLLSCNQPYLEHDCQGLFQPNRSMILTPRKEGVQRMRGRIKGVIKVLKGGVSCWESSRKWVKMISLICISHRRNKAIPVLNLLLILFTF